MNLGVAMVLGGSGFVGSRLVRRLAEEGAYEQIRSVDFRAPRVRMMGVDYREHDIRRPIPEDWGRGVTTIFNLAAIHTTPGHEPHEYYETNIAGAINATNLAVANGATRMVFASSISVYGPSEETLTEESELSPTSDYGRSKRLAERIHQQWLEAADARRLVIVRPGVIFGPGEGGNYTTLVRALRRRIFFYPGRRDAIKSSGYVDDLISALDFALRQDERSVVFNYAFPTLSTTEDIVSAISRVLDLGSRPPTIPASWLLLAALPFEIANGMGLRNRIHRDRVRKLIHSTKVYPQWLVSRDYTFTADLESGLRAWGAETADRFD